MPVQYDTLHVLIIDDHDFTRLLLNEVLQGLGCAKDRIFEAEDGASGLRILQERDVDLIICDWQMAPMDGLAFVRTVRDPAKTRNPYVPIIFCTGYSDRKLVENARDAGVSEVVIKPITVKAIESRVASILQKPRDFVQAEHYFGPDRRRRREKGEIPNERRANGEPPAKN